MEQGSRKALEPFLAVGWMEFDDKPLSLFLLVGCRSQVGSAGTAGLVRHPPRLSLLFALLCENRRGHWGGSSGAYIRYPLKFLFQFTERPTASYRDPQRDLETTAPQRDLQTYRETYSPTERPTDLQPHRETYRDL